MDSAKKLARRGDPWTSKKSAEEIIDSLSALRKRAFDLIKANPGKIARELSDIANDRDERKIGRRLNELEELGLIRRGEERKCAVTGRYCATWYLTERV